MKKLLVSLAALCVIVLLYQCGPDKRIPGNNTGTDYGAAPPQFTINFNPYPPQDLPDSNATPEQLVSFAWEEFLALNWQASYAKDSIRDNPDTTWNFSSPGPFPPRVVWETFGHRTELRPYSNKMLPFDAPPHYSFGVSLKPYPGSNATLYGLFDVLDENNEIGSCDMYAHVNEYDRQYMVLYQAKANRDEYEYIYNNYPDTHSLAVARNNTLNNISQYKAYYKGATGTCNCPQGAGVICLPCGGSPNPNKPGTNYTGAMEVKTAWRELTPLDDSTKFFTRKVVYFRQIPGDKQVYYDNKTYALIGLHIIHKTSNYQDFVFATWEHVEAQDDSMGYVLLNNNGQETGPTVGDFPREHPIPALASQATDYVHAMLKKMNPNSIWLNYRLIGVQAKPTNDVNSFSFFLANYVVESDSTLANFRGSGIGTPHDGLPNTLYKGNMISMGGCQGCHGVSQTKSGTDFSFLLDNVGKPVYSPDIRNDQTKGPSKLTKLVRATR
jgi:hypothetical protein